jgi:hypothetical protein
VPCDEFLEESDSAFNGFGCAGDLLFTFNNSMPLLQAGVHYRWDYVFGEQNFSSITFLGSSSDAVGGVFSVSPLVNAKFAAFAVIAPPLALNQLQVNGTTPIIEGGTTNSSIVVLDALLPSALPDSLQLQVELEPSFVSFKNVPTLLSAFIGSGAVASVSAPGLLSGAYHWQARSVDQQGNKSLWQTISSPPATADFFVQNLSSNIVLQDNVTGFGIGTQPNACFGDGSMFSCALSPVFKSYIVSSPFAISKITFNWHNGGSNNCDGLGNYGAVITSSSTTSSVVAQSTNTIYLGCAGLSGGTGGVGELDFTGQTIPASFYLTFGAFDGAVQGGSAISVSNITVYARTVALPPVLSVSPTSVDFDRQIIGMPSPTKSVVIENTGGGTLIPIINVSGDFSLTNDCRLGLSAGQTCQVTLTFTPSELATRTGTLSISSESPALRQGVSLQGFGALSFPLSGFTAYTAIINTTFDHSMKNRRGEYQVYGCDQTVVDFLGEAGNKPPSGEVFGCSKGYAQVPPAPFLASVAYSGAHELFYDGHPGYDYVSKFHGQVLATARGIVKYPTHAELLNEGVAVGGDPDNLQVLELDAADDVKIFYLHLSTHPRTISLDLSQNSTQQDFDGQPDPSFRPVLFQPTNLHLGHLEISGTVTESGRPLPSATVQLSGRTVAGICIYELTNADEGGHYKFDRLAEGFYNLRPVQPGFRFSPALQTVLNENSYVNPGDPIGESGNAGGEPSCFAPHLHFEVQRRAEISVIDHANAGKINLRFIPVDPYGCTHWIQVSRTLTSKYQDWRMLGYKTQHSGS